MKHRRESGARLPANVPQGSQKVEIKVGRVPDMKRASSRMGRAFCTGDTALHKVQCLAHLIGEDFPGSCWGNGASLAV